MAAKCETMAGSARRGDLVRGFLARELAPGLRGGNGKLTRVPVELGFVHSRCWLRPVLILSMVSFVACRNEPLPQAEKAAPRGSASAGAQARQVELEPVSEQALDKTVEITGTLAADEQVTAAAKVPGRVAELLVDLASTVKRGDIVAKLESTDYVLRVQQAEAALAQAVAQLGVPSGGAAGKADPENTAIVRQARATLNEAQANVVRSRTLAGEGLVTGMQLDAAEAAVVRAETSVQAAIEEVRLREAQVGQRRSELSIARQQLADTIIKSPLDGVVQRRSTSVGEYLAVGAPIADIVRINPLRLRVSIPERDTAGLRSGLGVLVRVDGDPASYAGKLARVAPALDLQSRTLLVEADIENPGGLRPGSLVSARIIVGSKKALTIPKSAVVTFAGLNKVFSVEKGKAVEKRVTLGQVAGERVEVVSGVKLGDSVIVRAGSLQQGELVQVRQAQPASADTGR